MSRSVGRYHNVITSETPPPKLSPKTILTDDDYGWLDRALRDLSDDQRVNDFITRLNNVIEDIVRKKEERAASIWGMSEDYTQ